MKAIAAFGLAMLGAVGVARAQTFYPDRPINVVVSYAAGGYIDTFARLTTAKLAEVLGQPIVVVNRPGAGGSLGMDSVIRAKPDGYTLAIHSSSTMAIYSALNADTPDPNFPPISIAAIVASTPGVMAAASSLGAPDFRSMMARIKAEPGKHAYGSAGIGTPSHLWSGQIARALGLDIQHVPFAGGAPALNDLMAGRLAWVFDTPVGTTAAIQSGKAIPVAVLSPVRVAGLMNVPTVGELGFPEISDEVSTLSIMGPAGVPREILEKLNAAYMKALKETDLVERFAALGSYVPEGARDIDAARAFSVRDYAKWFETSANSGVRAK